eukprot:TRINITY_DN2130_c0_g1_i1.p1 TRINITY_DN2130_c0_g1~~TRINITY_DN2130_c0_g1_i1.p1  ORF type:complete len:414 (+),score=78.69 TRINITY_DN2130_c0_g1_i1:43-1284(+)
MSLPLPPPTHPASTTGHVPHDSIGPLPPHLADIGSPERQNSIQRVDGRAGSPSYYQPMHTSPTHHVQPAHDTHSSPTYHSQYAAHSSPTYAHTSPTHYSQTHAHTSQVPPVQGKTYEQEVNEFLDQTSPARIREQTPTNLPPDSYMAKANHESMTNENSPARVREGSPYTSYQPAHTSSVHHSSPTHYSQPAHVGHSSPTHYSQPVHVTHSSPTYAHQQPAGYSSPTHYSHASQVPPVQGKTYEQEVNEYLDQTSPARIREQTPTNLPPDSYMAKANHESMTNENSPARVREGSPYQSTGYQPHVSTHQPVSTGYQPQPHVSTGYQPASYQPQPHVSTHSAGYQPAYGSPQKGYVGEYAPSTVAGSPGHADLGSIPPPGPGIPGDGESPRRLRAFGHPHSDPNAPNQSPQRGY